jgi:hypothetical protein
MQRQLGQGGFRYFHAIGSKLTKTLSRALAVALILNLAAPVATFGINLPNDRLEEPATAPNDIGSSLRAVCSAAVALPSQNDCYPDAPPELIQSIRVAAQLIVDKNEPNEIGSRFFPILLFAIAHAISVDPVDIQQERRELINRIETSRFREQIKRTDKQLGASAGAGGTTSAVEKPGFAELLGLAIERGTIQQQINETTLTLSSSPYAIVAAGPGDTAATYKTYGYLARVGISANFNITDQNNPLANARRSQLAGWSIRTRLTPDRTLRSRNAEEIWERVSSDFAQPALVITGELAKQFQSDRELEAKRREIIDRFHLPIFTTPAKDALSNTLLTPEQKTDQIAKLILCQVKADIFNQVRSGAFKLDPATRGRIINQALPILATALQAKESAIKAFEDQLKDLSYKPITTLVYTNIRETMKPNYSVLKVLFEKKTREGVSFIANGGLSIYHNPIREINQQQVRDYAFALSVEGNAGRSPFLSEGIDESQITFSFTGRYQRLLENRGVMNKKADIAVAQFKLEIPLFTGVALPFSITYANATELIKEDHVRANFGFTLDTDKIFQVLRLRSLRR